MQAKPCLPPRSSGICIMLRRVMPNRCQPGQTLFLPQAQVQVVTPCSAASAFIPCSSQRHLHLLRKVHFQHMSIRQAMPRSSWLSASCNLIGIAGGPSTMGGPSQPLFPISSGPPTSGPGHKAVHTCLAALAAQCSHQGEACPCFHWHCNL